SECLITATEKQTTSDSTLISDTKQFCGKHHPQGSDLLKECSGITFYRNEYVFIFLAKMSPDDLF
ncbi:hypothetical protein ACQP3D_30450, partial [Escherichia coli]